jgi:hypothetical protein
VPRAPGVSERLPYAGAAADPKWLQFPAAACRGELKLPDLAIALREASDADWYRLASRLFG